MDEEQNKVKSVDKVQRVLGIYSQLMRGEPVKKITEAQNYGVNERSIQRDLSIINVYMDNYVDANGYSNNTIEFDSETNSHYLMHGRMRFTNPEILAICKILLDSRAFTKQEMHEMLDKLIKCCVPKENQKLVRDLILNEEYHYIEPRHKRVFTEKMWEIGQAIQDEKYIEITYIRLKDGESVIRKVKPVAIMFSEYYFYMTAFIDDDEVKSNFDVINDSFPTIYRIDRIQELKVLNEHFRIPYKDRFEEGEFRKRIQFMYGGKLRKIKFKYTGLSVEAILDRLPTAKILDEEDGGYIISAEVFGDGIDMWLRSQGDRIEVVE